MALRRYFEGLLLLLIATGFVSLASTGRLAWPVTAIAAGLLLARGVCWWRRRTVRIAGRWWAIALLLYVPVAALDALMLSGSYLQAGLHFVVLAGAARSFSMENAGDEVTLAVLAFLEVLTAALLTVSGVFFLLFLLFLALLVAAAMAREMARAEAQAGPVFAGGCAPDASRCARPAGAARSGWSAPPGAVVAPPGQRPRRRALLRFSLLLSVGVALGSMGIFFLLPRTALGAWGGRPGTRGLSGFSDDVQLGQLASLQRDNRPVMHIRVTASDPPLDPAAFAAIPWRGRGLTEFDGARWTNPDPLAIYGTQSGRLTVSQPEREQAHEIVGYQVTLEPMNSPVLFFPSRLLRASTRFPMLAWDRETATLTAVGANLAGASYSGVSDVGTPSQQLLRAAPPWPAARLHYGLQQYLELPPGLDSRIPELARRIVQHTQPDAYDRLQALTEYLQTHYQYTLTDLPQGADPLGTFLLDQPAGDCEYFASALAVMARSLDIPTRLVNGFLLGSYNPISGEYLVRGSDAHAWVEAYLPLPPPRAADGRERFRYTPGVWTTWDATPPATTATDALWPPAGMVLDALSSFWQEWIINYDWLRQGRLALQLEDHLNNGLSGMWAAGAGTVRRAAAAVDGADDAQTALRGWDSPWRWGLVLAAILAGFGLRRRTRAAWSAGWQRRWPWARPQDDPELAAQLAYRRFQRLLRRSGVVRAAGDTAHHYLHVLSARGFPAPVQQAAGDFVNAYNRTRFGPPEPEAIAVLWRRFDQFLTTARRHPAPS